MTKCGARFSPKATPAPCAGCHSFTARLASLAGAGEILASEAACEADGMAGEGFERRVMEFKGKSEPVSVWGLRAGG